MADAILAGCQRERSWWALAQVGRSFAATSRCQHWQWKQIYQLFSPEAPLNRGKYVYNIHSVLKECVEDDVEDGGDGDRGAG